MLATLDTDTVIVAVQRAEIDGDKSDPQANIVRKAEVDEMQSFVGKKATERWLWHAIDHRTGEILAYMLGSRHSGSVSKTEEVVRAFWH